jgi:hypothetical protein
MCAGYGTTHSGRRRRVPPYLLGAILLLVPGATGVEGKWHDRHKPVVREFHDCAIIALDNLSFGPKRLCIPIAVFLWSVDFFDGLRRVRNPLEFEFHYFKGSVPVREFPEFLIVEISLTPSSCRLGELVDHPHPPFLWDEQFMRSWRLRLSWVRGSQVMPVEIISSGKEFGSSVPLRMLPWGVPFSTALAEGGWVPTRDVLGRVLGWSYYFWVKSKGIPISDTLKLELVTPDGDVVARLLGSLDRAL